MSKVKQKKQKESSAKTIEELIEEIKDDNITQSQIISKLLVDDDLAEELKQSPVDDINRLAEELINKMYFKALRTLQEEYQDVQIFNLMDDIMTYEYISVLYINKKEQLLPTDAEHMIHQGALDALTYSYNRNVLDVTKEIVDYAKKEYNNDDTDTKLTIYKLLKQIYKDEEVIKEAQVNRDKFCNKNEVIPAIVYNSTTVVLPYFQVLPMKFIVDLLFEESYPIRTNGFIQFDQSSYLGGLPSIFNKEHFEQFNVDRKWFIDSNNYLINLPREDKFTVYGYTHNGDVIVNMILRGRENEVKDYVLQPEKITDFRYQPLFFHLRKTLLARDYGIPQNILAQMLSSDILDSYNAICKKQTFKEAIPLDAYVTAAKMFLSDLRRIIENSPPITQKTTVYRGSKTLYYSTTNRRTFKNNTFMSTSYGVWSPTNFTNKQSKCCIKKITLNPGTKALFMDCITQYESESEILLPPDYEFKIISHEINTYYDMPSIEKIEEDTVIENFCLGRKNYMTLTTMEQI